MHELSIVASIVEIAEEHVRKAGASSTTHVELEIGELAGVEWKALEFAWEVAVKNTVLENAKRHLVRVPGLAKCAECAKEFNAKSLYDPCPVCGSYFNVILRGKELRVKALTVV